MLSEISEIERVIILHLKCIFYVHIYSHLK